MTRVLEGGRRLTTFRQKQPVLLPGFYASLDDPYNAYDCRNEVRCPGGVEPSQLTSTDAMCMPNAQGANCGMI